MPTKIFVNLHVKELKRSVEFFTKVGYTFNEQFTDENATCMVISDTIYVMLLIEPFFESFSDRKVCDTSKYMEANIALDCENRREVDEMVAKAVAAGATTPVPPQDHGFMYEYGFTDLDGHAWSYFYMDMSAVPQQ
ncbi:MAG: glyoxalase/bleomycin resistance/extradiol dioxygenase family protein [Flavobacterium sp.]|uniref:VOC family protein n=1 Tax=Flavobacterium sp. TaxID=239 RepID=UPI0012232190|nr:VOC family protein [Flavobacterium sp.]RZJ64561.1 MAG: glyoxalase/bleomycin resistance/extradiol dioxygenase family protein [Flavobacterium sp.]